jgi:orotidine-5'-phosphate decarboxylase
VPERPVNEKLVLAIDQTEVADILRLGRNVLGRVGCVKISSHLVQRMPPGRAFEFVRNHRARTIFYDARFVDDRPDNLAADIRVVCGDNKVPIRPPEWVSVHHAVGRKGLVAAVKAAEDRTEVVVFLGSSNWDPDDYQAMHDARAEDVVRKWARIAAEAGVHAVMCAAADAWVIKEDPDCRHLLVYGTGIRDVGEQRGEHKRTVSPEDALRNGVDYCVVGSPIVNAHDPSAVLDRYANMMRHYRRRKLL